MYEMNIVWLKKYEKVYLMSEKEKQWKGDFLVKSSNILITIKNFCIISFYFYHSKPGFYVCFFNCQSFLNVANYDITIKSVIWAIETLVVQL